MAISGNVTTEAGVAADLVRIFRWADGELHATVTPDASGNWSLGYAPEGDYGVTYIADGCQPVTDGPYFFDQSAAGDPHWNNVVALLHFNGNHNGSNFVDETGKTWSARGGARTTVLSKKFGESSGAFERNSDYLRSISSPDWAFGTGDFTIEAWVNTTPPDPSLNGNWDKLIFGSFNSPIFVFYVRAISNTLSLYDGTGYFSDIPVPSGRWVHVAMSRGGGQLRMFIDGVQCFSAPHTKNFSSNGPHNVGAMDGSSRSLSGFIDGLRITKSVARYTGGFEVPLAPFPSSAP